MYKKKKVAVVVPAYNVEHLVTKVIETMPKFVDKIIVVDDASRDKTTEVVKKMNNKKVYLVRHDKNQGVGAAIATGYKIARNMEFDVTVVMAGDAQMDPKDLPAILNPVIKEEADYSKGNRLFDGQLWEKMPKIRIYGNAMLSMLTKIASGYWHIADSPSGYTAINLRALKTINWDNIFPRYGVPSDILVKLNVYNFKVVDVPINPVYGVGEKSGIRVHRAVHGMSLLLLKLFFWRLKEKYIKRDFHPLVLFYIFGMIFLFSGLIYGGFVFYEGIVAQTSAAKSVFAMLLFITGLQLILNAMKQDADYNR